MIRPLLTGILLIASALAGTGQDMRNNALIRARYLVSEKQYAEAVTILENQQPAGSDPMRSALAMGQALSGLGKFDDSNTWLLQVTGDGAADASYCLAKNYLALNDYPAAIEYLEKHLSDKNHYPEKQVRLDPAFSKLESNREWVHLWQKDWYPVPEQQAAECAYLISQGQLDEAQDLAKAILIDYPNEPHAMFILARISFLRKEDRQFRESLDKAWKTGSDYPLLRDEMLQFALGANDYEKVNAMAGELLRKDPTNPEYLITRALVRILDGKESLALKEIEATEEAGIAPAELYYQAGRKISASQPQQAESYLSRAIDTGIMDARFYSCRGIVRADIDKTDLALGDLAMSLDINPNQPDLYYDRARIRLDRGDTEGACHDWQKALELGNARAADQLYKYCRLP